jgi:FkbM family methyltransferase
MYCANWPDIEKLGDANSWHVATKDLVNSSIVYSAGVGRDISFELQLVRRFGATVHLFDPSPTGQATMADPSNRSELVRFVPIGLAGTTGHALFRHQAPYEGAYSIGGTGADASFPVARVGDLMKERGHSRIDLLKIDIEGFEYSVIDDVVEQGLDVRQLCVEFHHWFPNASRTWTVDALRRLKQIGFQIVHKVRFDYTLVRGRSD